MQFGHEQLDVYFGADWQSRAQVQLMFPKWVHPVALGFRDRL